MIGDRIQRLRIANGLSQAQLADDTDLPSGVISMVEHGRHSLDDYALERVAVALSCSPEYLRRATRELVATRPWLRAYADASKKAVDRYVADSETAIDVLEHLSLHFYPESIPTFDGDVNDEDSIEDFAEHVRGAAGLSEGDVVGNCIRRAERLGVVVLPMDDELGRHLGLSIRVNSVPVVRVSRPVLRDDGTQSPSGDRQRFTVAHELGHLTLHATTPPPANATESRAIEQQAHRFAGAFLAPADALLGDLEDLGGRVTLSTLTKLKERWGVAIKMLVVRLTQLGKIDDTHARSLYKQISARRWNTQEPVAVDHENAVWLPQALRRATSDPSPDFLTRSGLDPQYFRQWQDWDPRSEALADVIPLSRRSRKFSSVR